MFALHSRRLRRRLSAPTSGSARRRARERQRAQQTRAEGEQLARERREQRYREKMEHQRIVSLAHDCLRLRQRAYQTRAEGEQLARERREQRYREKMEHQRIARQQLASYEPWGRAGGGAPNPRGVRYTDLRTVGIFPEDELKGTCPYEACRRWPSPRRRRRTPLRLREDPQLCYADTLRKTIDNDIRYRLTPDQQKNYKEILDDLVDKRKKAMKDEIKRNKEYERKMQTMDGPWGKPGPGGTTWRNPRDIGLNFSKSMGWTDNEIFNKIKVDHKRCKKSSLALPQVKRDDDSTGSEQPDKENIKPSNVDKLPDIKNTNSANGNQEKAKNKSAEKEKKEPVNASLDNEKKEFANSDTNKPKKRSPNKNKFVKRLPNGERIHRIVSDDLNMRENGEDVLVEKKPTPEAAILRVTGGIELVPLLARRRRVGARTLPSSDVTRPPEQACEWRELLHADYLRELKQQMQVKFERKQERRRDSAESVRKHHETWSSLWGRPGHGAPQQRGKYARSNLAQLLYAPRLICMH